MRNSNNSYASDGGKAKKKAAHMRNSNSYAPDGGKAQKKAADTKNDEKGAKRPILF
jgi:hypothetical protein